MSSLSKKILSFFLFFLVCECMLLGCSTKKEVCKIGYDPYWYPNNFGQLEVKVFGFIEDLFLEISKESNVEFQLVRTNWSDLFYGLEKKEFDLVLSSLQPYNFNEKKYGFSSVFLDTGPILIYKKDLFSKKNKNEIDLNGRTIGAVAQDQAVSYIHKYQNVIIYYYPSAADVFNNLIFEHLDAVILNKMIALSFLNNKYYQTFSIENLANEGLRVVSLKDNPKFNKLFEIFLKKFQKNGKLESFLEKWGLQISNKN